MSSVLGINARNLLYIKPSLTKRAARVVDNKLLTKKILTKEHIPVPNTYGTISNSKELAEFEWGKLPPSFALKPNRGFGGEGILIVFGKKKKAKETAPVAPLYSVRSLLAFGKKITTEAYVQADGNVVSLADMQNHIRNIIDGTFSLGSLPDTAFFEERIKILKLFKAYSVRGIPDIRIIVYNSIPVMAELRIPTKESEGKSNLHLGGIGVGIDMGSGMTAHAVHHDRPIDHIPGTLFTLRGIRIPEWGKILELAIRAQKAVRCPFLGADISIDRDRGPIILELNARPGLAIQTANMAPLRERLERIRGLSIPSTKKGSKIAQDLFGGGVEEELEELSGKKVIGTREQIVIYGANKERYTTFARVDTGAYRTAISRAIAEKLHLTEVLKYKKVRGALGKEERPIIDLVFELDKERIKTEAYIASRQDMEHDIIIGRKDLKKFLVDPSKLTLLNNE